MWLTGTITIGRNGSSSRTSPGQTGRVICKASIRICLQNSKTTVCPRSISHRRRPRRHEKRPFRLTILWMALAHFPAVLPTVTRRVLTSRVQRPQASVNTKKYPIQAARTTFSVHSMMKQILIQIRAWRIRHLTVSRLSRISRHRPGLVLLTRTYHHKVVPRSIRLRTLKQMLTSRVGTEHQETFPFQGPISLDRATGAIDRKRKTPVYAAERSKGVPSASPLENVNTIPSPLPRHAKRAKTSRSTEPVGRVPSEGLGNLGASARNRTSATAARKSRALESSPLKALTRREITYSASPCPPSRKTSISGGDGQPPTPPIQPSVGDDPACDNYEQDENDDLDLVFVSSRKYIPAPSPDDPFHEDLPARSPDRKSRGPSNSSTSGLELSEITEHDLALTLRLITDMKTKLCGRPDKPGWFDQWHLKNGFSEANLLRMKDGLRRGEFTPCPLLMCDAGDTTMASQTLAEVIKKHIINRSAYMSRKHSAALKNKNPHLVGDHRHDCSHKCHNYWYEFWLHLCAELHRDNIDREKAGCREQLYFNDRLILFCSSHPSEPCRPGCHSLSRLEQVIYQWMAAKGYARFSQMPSFELDGAEDLPKDILDTHLDTYFAVQEKGPYDGAPEELFLVLRSTHRLGDLISDQVEQSNSASASINTSRPPAKGSRSQSLSQKTPHKTAKVLETKVRQTIRRPVPSNQEQFEKWQKHQIEVQNECLEFLYESPEGQELKKEHSKFVGFVDGAGLPCYLCRSLWYACSDPSTRVPKNPPVNPTFNTGTKRYMKHHFAHAEYDESVRCRHFLAMLDDTPAFGKICPFHQSRVALRLGVMTDMYKGAAHKDHGFDEAIRLCKLGNAPSAALMSRFVAPRK